METRLKPLTTEPQTRRIVAWDIETTTDAMIPFLVGIRWGSRDDQSIQFQGSDCIKQTIEWFLADSETNPGTCYYAHNGGGFDHQFAIYEMVTKQAGRFRVMPIISGGSSILVFVREKGTQREFAMFDSLRLFIAQSLSSIGKKMGVALKGEMDLKAPITDPRWLDYNNRDTLTLWEAVSKLQNAVQDLGGQLCATAASTSMDLFRRRFLKREIDPAKAIHTFIRQTYVGGRTERFDTRVRKGPINYYDVNSLYPFACLRPLPVERTETGNATIEGLPSYNRDNECLFASCLVEVPETCNVPPLPVRSGGKLIFPVGRFWGKWSTPDLENLLLAGGRVLKTNRWYRFKCEPIAHEMMTELYAQRKSDRPEMQVAAKGLMNSFYGKFGQKPDRNGCVFFPDPGDTDEGEWQSVDEESTTWLGKSTKDYVHILPQIASHVTSLARSIHYPYLLSCRDLIYCDTDSMVTTDTIPNGPELGQMKLEHEGIQEFRAIGPKMYRMTLADGTQVEHAKGFGGWAKEKFEKGIVEHLADGGSVRVRGPMKLKGLIRSGDLRPREKTSKDGSLGNIKKLQKPIEKRTINHDGTTSPLRIYEA